MMPTMIEIGENMRLHRRLRRISQQELGNKAGISPYTISQIESGNRWPTLFVIACLAEALGLSLTEYLSSPPEPMRYLPKKRVKK